VGEQGKREARAGPDVLFPLSATDALSTRVCDQIATSAWPPPPPPPPPTHIRLSSLSSSSPRVICPARGWFALGEWHRRVRQTQLSRLSATVEVIYVVCTQKAVLVQTKPSYSPLSGFLAASSRALNPIKGSSFQISLTDERRENILWE